MSLRKIIAILALVNAFVALYLHLSKLGVIPPPPCTAGGGCAYVQGSRFGWFLGVDVALIGTVGYTLLLLVASIGSLPNLEDAAWPATLLQLMVWPAVLFTVRLKYGEFVVLKSFCPWCAISAVSITVCAVLVTLERRRVRRLESTTAS